MAINPFDEPNVKQAKDATSALLTVYEQCKRLPLPEPHAEINGVRLTLSEAAQAALGGAPATSFLDPTSERRLRPSAAAAIPNMAKATIQVMRSGEGRRRASRAIRATQPNAIRAERAGRTTTKSLGTQQR